jgi:isopenicillin N synthase-like dioxygenase
MKKFTLALPVFVCSILSAFDSTIPVLHLPDFFSEEKKGDFLKDLEKAAVEVGFFALTGTGVDPSLLNSSYEQMTL